MPDLSRIQSSQPIQITDDSAQAAVLSSSNPAGTEVGLIVRNIPSGTQTVAGSVSAVPTGTYTVTGSFTSAPSALQTITGKGTAGTADAEIGRAHV